ncbi:MAG TPA: hypothetical protein VK864_05565, partial [Longimicrobiales bacterium]|nr:hypothetical protein [Longimicrobiales bacterium]
RPSMAFEPAQSDAAERARNRGTVPDRLLRRLRGDLDAIVLKALQKEPDRRYPSVAALQSDLQRFRAGLPVTARPTGAGYRLRKFVRRNRAAVAAAMVAVVALVSATAFSAVQMREAQRQRDTALQEVKRQQALAEVQTVLAGDARGPDGRLLLATERIALAEQVLTRRFAHEPWLVVETMTELGGRLYDLGDRPAMRALLGRARTMARTADLPTQIALIDCARAMSLAFDDHLDSARAALAEGTRALRRPGARTDLAAAECLDAEGQLLAAEGKPDSAVVLLSRAVALARNANLESMRLQTLNNLATALRAAGRTREASEYYHQVVKDFEARGYQGTDLLPNLISFLNSALSELGEIAKADSIITAAIVAQNTGTGREYTSGVLHFLHGLAKLRTGELDSAETWIRRAHRDTTESAGGLVWYLPPALTQLYLEQGRLAEARAAFKTLPSGTFVRRANSAWFGAWIRYAEGDRQGGARTLEDSLRVLTGGETPSPALAMLYVTAAAWRLAAGDAHRADSLAQLGRAAAAVDSLALQRSGYVGRAELIRARAQLALGNRAGARQAAEHAVIALTNGLGPANRHTREARALRDSIPQ